MNKLAIMSKMPRVVNKSMLQLKKYSPEILVVSGVVGTVVSAVMACKATTKLSTILNEHQDQMDKIHEVVADEDIQESGVYTGEDAKKDTVIVYTQTALKVAKLYAPAVILGGLSITSILASNNILRKRNVALAAAYTAVDKSFKEYRTRVIERFGERVDKELKYDIKAQKVEEVVVDPDTGKEKKVKKTIDVVNLDDYSEYARFYDDGCKGWEKDSEMNLLFLKSQQQYANDLLRARGHLFLNEVYDMLGIPRSKAGQVVGWVYDDSDENHGDNYVSFGIYDIHKPKSRDFVNGYERTILLDFNVDGNIWELMK